ncbi:MAG: rod shape-determining protein MreC [Bacteroidota bacterium]
MRNLLQFLWRYNFFIFFLLLEVLCLYLIVQNNNYHRARFFNSTNALAVKVNSVVSAVAEYINLKATNEALARQNAALKSILPDAYYVDSALAKTFNDTVYKQQYRFMVAKVVNNSINRRSNYLTLDRGSLQGVKPEMGVICADGIVGIVKDVSEHYCSVISFLHKDTRISARVQKNGFIGSMVWEGYDPASGSLMDIAKHVKLAVGDTIVTSSFSTIFPEGIMIGKIQKLDPKTGVNFQDVDVDLSTKFGSLTHVYLIDNVLKSEQKKLEEAQKNDR